jgi:hypothetical protein
LLAIEPVRKYLIPARFRRCKQPRAVPALSLPSQSHPLAEQTFNFRFVSLGVLMTDALARQVAGKFVQLECPERDD